MAKRITVIGNGFAAVSAVEQLRKEDSSAEITVIAPDNRFVFLPSLIWIPSRKRKPSDLIVPLTNFYQRHRVHHHQAHVTGLTNGGRTVLTSDGAIDNDGVIIASGGRFLKKLKGIEHAITPCEGIPAALAIRNRLEGMSGGTIAIGFAGNPNEPAAMRGGPMFEFLFGIDTLLRQQKRRDKFKLIFFSPAPKPGNRLGPEAVSRLLDEMAKRDIDTHLGHKMKQFSATSVTTEGGEFAADLILFMPGMTGNKWFDNSDLARSEGGLLKADAYCRVVDAQHVYVAGDSGSFPGPEWLPKQAHMAELQARTAARNLMAELNGDVARETFKIELMCIVDSNDKGMLVVRTPKHNLMLPSSRLWHWSKRFFEQWYLRKLR